MHNSKYWNFADSDIIFYSSRNGGKVTVAGGTWDFSNVNVTGIN